MTREPEDFVHTLLQDLRFALRQLRQSPGFTLAAVLTLAIGIGANTAFFSVMDAMVLHPLAVPELDRVMTVEEQQNRGDLKPVALANYEDWQRQSRSFEELAVHSSADMSLTGAGDAAHVQAEYASPNFFSVMRANALLGQVFGEGETQPGRSSVAVLSYYFWKQHFASDAGVLGRTIDLNGHTYTIIGVMPKALQYPTPTDLFLPFAPDAAQIGNRSAHDYLVIGRLNSGVTKHQAQAEMNVLAERLAGMYPVTNQGWTVKVEPLLDTINGDIMPRYFNLILGATLFVLLVVCLNVSNLQLARGIARQPEIALRTALGAGRMRVLRQLLTENILLGLIGGAGGLLDAWIEMHSSMAELPARVMRYVAGSGNISLNGRVLCFSLLMAMGAGVVSGIAPALAALRVNLVDQLKSGSRAVAGASRTRWVRNVFAVSQIALAMALVIGAALMSKSLTAILHSADRFNPGQMLTFDAHLTTARYDTAEKMASWQNQSLEKLRALPGVERAELSTALPSSDQSWLDDCQIENRPLAPGRFQSALRLHVSNGYFSEFNIPLVSGRLFNPGDDLRSPPVAVVSRGFVARYFPGENPLGHRIRMGAGHNQTPWTTIAGVAEDTDYSILNKTHEAAVYLSAAQIPPQDTVFALVTSGDPLALAPAARKALAGLDPALPLDWVQTLAELRREELSGIAATARILAKDALIALLLAAIGIFGVMANLVAERTREIGVRLAMGARREDVVNMILRRAAWLTGIGVGSGLLLAFGLAHGVASLLYGVSPNDPAVFGSITAAIAGIALLASWLPARRASRIDPMVALRDE
jgi:putative ABC transport system permease protein